MDSDLEYVKRRVQARAERLKNAAIGLPFRIRHDKNTVYEGTIAEVTVKVQVRGHIVEALFVVRLKNARGDLIPGVFCVNRLPRY